MNVNIRYWQYDNGLSEVTTFDKTRVGWFCWVYTDDNAEFVIWMGTNCPTAYFTSCFNSGDPMFTVLIRDKDEAAYFKLTFGG